MIIEDKAEAWAYIMIDGRLLKQRPWCDCAKPVWRGFTRRSDGVWVRPCCMRQTETSWKKWRDQPIPHDHYEKTYGSLKKG